MTSALRSRRVAAGTLAVLSAVLPLIFSLLGGVESCPDLAAVLIPHAERIRRDLFSSGALPKWDFWQFGGTAYLGNLTDGILYPPHVLLLGLPPALAFPVLEILHLALAAFGLYRLTRSYHLSRASCVLGAAAYSMSFMMAGRVAAGHYLPLVAVCQAPLLLYLIRRTVQKREAKRLLALGLYGGILPLGGHVSFLYQLGLIAVAFGLAEIWRLARTPVERLRTSGLLVAAAILACLIAAPLLLPAAEVRAYATRGTAEGIQSPDRLPVYHSLAPRDAAAFWIPLYPMDHYVTSRGWNFLWHEKAVYAGLIPLHFGLFALLGRPRRPPVLFFTLAILIAGLDAMAAHTPVHRLAAAILPGYGSFRIPARSVWICVLGLSILAAFGADRWSKEVRQGRPLLKTLSLLALPAIAAACLLAFRHGVRGQFGFFVLLLPVSLAVLYAIPRLQDRGMAIAVVLTAVELAVLAGAVRAASPRGEEAAPPWYVAQLGENRSDYRVLRPKEILRGYQPALFGIRQIDGYGYPLLEGTRRLYSRAFEQEPAVSLDTLGHGGRIKDGRPLDWLNVGWVVDDSLPSEQGLEEVARNGDEILYRRPTARSYAFAGAQSAPARRAPDSIQVRLRLASPETLVVSESWMPGWRARVNGRPADVRPYEGALLSIDLPAGDHEVNLTYEPARYRIGLWIASLTLLGIAAYLIVPSWMRRGRPPAPV